MKLDFINTYNYLLFKKFSSWHSFNYVLNDLVLNSLYFSFFNFNIRFYTNLVECNYDLLDIFFKLKLLNYRRFFCFSVIYRNFFNKLNKLLNSSHFSILGLVFFFKSYFLNNIYNIYYSSNYFYRRTLDFFNFFGCEEWNFFKYYILCREFVFNLMLLFNLNKNFYFFFLF